MSGQRIKQKVDKLTQFNVEYKAYRVILRELERLNEITQQYLKRRRIEEKARFTQKIESSKDFIERARAWSGQSEIASLLAWQLYVKAQAYLDQKDIKNAQKFYDLMIKALKLSQRALERFDLEEFERRLKKLEVQSNEV
ncbi:MAG: hypothetical protein QW372_01730 [Nitrososphaerales archaeon]